MGNSNVRRQEANLANYGMEYDPYYNYGDIENYGSSYQPVNGYPFGFGVTDGPFVTTVKTQVGTLGAYGTAYPAGFNPILQPGLNGPKVRVIYVPSHIANGMQNLAQQGGVGGISPLNAYGGAGGFNPLNAYGGAGGINPLNAYGGAGGFNPLIGYPGAGGNPMAGGLGACGVPQMMPLSPMGSNCCSLSVQIPSAAPQIPYPVPCPPPMIQPMMPQMSNPYPQMMPQVPFSQPLPYLPNMPPSPFLYPMPILPQQIPFPCSPQMPPMMPQQAPFLPQYPGVPQQPICPQNLPGGFGNVPGGQIYGGYNQGSPLYPGLGSYGGFQNIGSNMIPNASGIIPPGYPQAGLGGYGSFGSNSNFSQAGLAGYGGSNQYPYNNYMQPVFNPAGIPGSGGFNQTPYGQGGYGNFGPQYMGGYNQPAINPYYGNVQPGLASYGQSFGAPNQPGYNGYILPQPYGAFQPPPYNNYSQPFGAFQQSPYGNYGQQQIGGFPQFPQQPVGMYPQQPFNPYPQQSYNNYPGANMNMFGGIPQNGIFPPASGFSSPGGPQLISLPGGTGRVRIVCCAFPE